MNNYKKRIIALLMIFTFVFLTLSPPSVSANEINFAFVVLADNTAEITGPGDKKIDKEVIIPEEISGYTVSAIGENAFIMNSRIETIVFPATLRTIKDCAFYNCTALTSVRLPESLEILGSEVFRGCKEVEGFEISENNEFFTTKDGVLYNKDTSILLSYPAGSKNSEFVIPDSVTTVSNSAFLGASYLESITFSENLVTIENAAFWNCTSLKILDFPQSLKEIKKNAFYGCAWLTAINFNDTLETVEEKAFFACTNRLTELFIPESVTAIGSMAFCFNVNSKAVTTITIHCIENSAAHIYAKNNKLSFAIETEETFTSTTEASTALPSTDENGSTLSTSSQASSSSSSTSPSSSTTTEKLTTAPLPTVPFTASGSQYLINVPSRYIKNVNENTTVAAFITNFGNSRIAVLNHHEEAVGYNSLVTTGSKLVLYDYNGKKLAQYSVVILGDTDADGLVTASDARLVLRASAGLENLDRAFYQAGNVLGQLALTAGGARRILRVSAGIDKFDEYTTEAILPEEN